MPVFRLMLVFAAVSALALLLAGCSNLPQRDDVVAQANQDNEIAFNVVKVDEAVVGMLAARPRPAFRERFKEYLPPPELKIAVGDTVSVVIWEAAANGLFGNSLPELPLRPRSATGRTRATAEEARPSRCPIRSRPRAARSSLSAPFNQSIERSPFAGPTPRARPHLRQRRRPTEPGAAAAFAPRDRGATKELARHAGQTGRPGTSIPDQPVGPDGTITIPMPGASSPPDGQRPSSDAGSRLCSARSRSTRRRSSSCSAAPAAR